MAGDATPGGMGGTLRVGAISTSLVDHVPAVVERMARHAPKAELTIVPGTSAQLYDAVRANELDIAFMVAPTFALSKSLCATPVERQPLVMIVGNGPDLRGPEDRLRQD